MARGRRGWAGGGLPTDGRTHARHRDGAPPTRHDPAVVEDAHSLFDLHPDTGHDEVKEGAYDLRPENGTEWYFRGTSPQDPGLPFLVAPLGGAGQCELIFRQ